jgi:hypothetical protein
MSDRERIRAPQAANLPAGAGRGPNMSEQDLIRALQELIDRHSRPAEARQLSAEVIARDRWRVGLLAGVTAFLWLAGIAGVLYMIFCFNQFIIIYDPLHPRADDIWGSQQNQHEFHAKMELHHSLEACEAAVPALLLAALGTVWLVFSSRRATLNQINLSLAEISEQLRRMRQPARPPEGG